jgi:hypothetical protein
MLRAENYRHQNTNLNRTEVEGNIFTQNVEIQDQKET